MAHLSVPTRPPAGPLATTRPDRPRMLPARRAADPTWRRDDDSAPAPGARPGEVLDGPPWPAAPAPSSPRDGRHGWTLVGRVVAAGVRRLRPAPIVVGTALASVLMTDIEGSCRLWERAPAAMDRAMVLHDALVTGAVTRSGGQVLRTKGEGDSSFAIFPAASLALFAAVDLQRRLATTTWPTPGPLRLRMVVATGDLSHRDGDVLGLPLCRAARVRSLARGGDVVLTAATASLVADTLPRGTSLLDRGVHTLPGLARSEHVYEVAWSDGGRGPTVPPLRQLR